LKQKATIIKRIKFREGIMIKVKKAMKSNRLMKAITGLKIKQFNGLVDKFEKNLKTTFAKTRKVNLDLGRKFLLETSSEKLFYILFYMKCYPTFDLAGFIFNADRSSCCRWTHWFMEALQMTLDKELVLPKRQIKDLDELLSEMPEIKAIYIDGTERPVRRPKDPEKQKENYSGKKKKHTKKNLVITTEEKEILLLTETREGKVHDYGNFKDEKIGEHLPKNISVVLDNGFQGIQKDYPGLTVVMPKRKPKGKELTQEDKENNREISSTRVVNEHAIGGVKRLRIVSDVYRNIKQGFEDKVMLNACGIWNYYLKTAST
jgi:hypothetical protein